MAKVLYYLGAGASCKVLPLAGQFSTSFEGLAESIDLLIDAPEKIETTIDFIEVVKQLKGHLAWVCDLLKSGITIDTLARDFYEQKRHDEYAKLKALINCLFIYLQTKKGIDSRYRSLIQALAIDGADGRKVLKSSVNIISWNYDNQLEMALWNFIEKKDKHYHSLREMEEHFVHVNGSIDERLEYYRGDGLVAKLMNPNRAVVNALEYYTDYLDHGRNSRFETTYAWEDEAKIRRKRSIKVSELADIALIIVIGYSFPWANNEADREILGNIKSKVEVHIQTMRETYDETKSRMANILPNCFYSYKDTSEFEIPIHLL